MYCSPIFNLDKEDDGKIGKVSVGVYGHITVNLGPRITVLMTYQQAIELLDNLTEGLSKVPESVKHMSDKDIADKVAEVEGWMS